MKKLFSYKRVYILTIVSFILFFSWFRYYTDPIDIQTFLPQLSSLDYKSVKAIHTEIGQAPDLKSDFVPTHSFESTDQRNLLAFNLVTSLNRFKEARDSKQPPSSYKVIYISFQSGRRVYQLNLYIDPATFDIYLPRATVLKRNGAETLIFPGRYIPNSNGKQLIARILEDK